MKDFSITTDPLLQDLMLTGFSIGMNRWDKTIGKIIDKALKDESLSIKLKSVILSIFFEKL